ncbi:MAG: insulinase family protein [Acidobacteriaceae bacterium]|jgi:zinc protease|nr:insulinase family protein [Acidobacteriaceae bacterium]
MMASLKRFGLAVVGIVSLVAVGGAQAPAPAPAALPLTQVIPLDAAVKTGTLPNGLRYFVRQNARPEKRLSLRLAVKAGSLFEADDQQGLAHLIEHMAFNGSAHFKPGELVSYFESTGARLGPHVNAYTSFDETVYMLDLPSDSAEIVAKGLLAMSDFAGGLTLSQEEVDKERGVVIEEWRGRLGAGSRISDQQMPILYYQSRYAERLPIGKPDIIRTAPVARLRDFYDTWYRPERMALIVVGDIKPDEIEASIRTTFGPLAARRPAETPPDTTVPLHAETLFKVTTDPEVTQSSVQLVRKRKAETSNTVGDYRRSIVESLFAQMLNARFGELTRSKDAKFLAAGGGGGSLGPSVDTFQLSARAKEGEIPAALTALDVEARRVLQFGFTATEFDRTKRELMAFYDRAYNERDKTESASFAQEYLNYVLNDEPSPGIDYERRLVQQLLPAITLDDVTTLAKARVSGNGEVILAVTPQKEGVPVPTEADLRAALTAGERASVTPWNDQTTTKPLIEKLPTPARIETRRELPDIGVTIVKFSNGVEAWLKPTDFKNDQVLFSMYSLGGASLASPDDYLQARFATQYIGLSGLNGIRAVDLTKLLAGKLASASPYIRSATHGISGSASPADLETGLQLLYQEFVAPGDDPDSLVLMKRQLEASLANRGRNPGQVFGEKVSEVNTSNHYTAKPLTLEDLPKLDRQKMVAFYKDRFSNAADFTFFMVGAFQIDSALPLLQRYVGGLPSTGVKSASYKDTGLRFPTGVIKARVQKGQEPRSQTLLSFYADPSFDPNEQERVIAATTILQTILRDSLREDLGQTYTVSVGLQQSAPERGAGSIAVSFAAAPENIDAMADRVLTEVKKLQADGPSQDLVSKAKEGARRDYETALKQNNDWMGRLTTVHLIGGNPSDIPTRATRIDALTAAAIQNAFKQYFPMDRYTIVTLMPEK